MRRVMLSFRWTLLFFALVAISNVGRPQSVNALAEQRTIRSDFGLADGATSNGALLFVPDVKNKILYSLNTKDRKWKSLSEGIGYSGSFFQLGHLYLADNRGAAIHRARPFGKPQVFAEFQDGARPNDLVVDKSGNVYATMTKEGQIRRVDQHRDVQIVAAGLVRPNGITMSPDGSKLYVSEVSTGKILAASIDGEGVVSEFRLFAQLPAGADGPKADGMCIDRAGNLYCTGYDAVWVFDPAGVQLRKIETEHRPINCAFGGPQGMKLFISTFGGLVELPVDAYGVAPNPPSAGPLAQVKGKPSTELPENLAARFNQPYYTEKQRKLLCDLIYPESRNVPGPAIVLVHGGGWLHGDKTKFRPLAIKLANAGYMVMSIEYRLGHEAKFPAGIHDCNAATQFLRLNAKQLGVDPEQICAVGGSAGGHLVGLMATASDVEALQAPGEITLLPPTQPNIEAAAQTRSSRTSTSTRLNAAVVMAGPMRIASGSVAERSQEGKVSNAIQWIGHSIDENPAPYHLADAHEKISGDDPPILFLTGSLDSPDRDEPSLTALKKAGVAAKQVVHEGAKHGHWNRIEWMDVVVNDILTFFKEQNLSPKN